ncbi:hypothetical protein [Arsukibacterium perlucidum]|uniref:hypothetical protein n=1 Tax=Arsukibacterium perlucidum TaxID=368811 RepID=UPI00035D30B9|nr:hypothetical protein [Arsukibacterium perlucidum]
MTTKNKGRPLPPLLPLEYCNIVRAARLLECEIEDILHWFEIGAIDLYLKVDDQNCGVLVLDKNEYQQLVTMGEGTESYKIGLSYMFISGPIDESAFNPETEMYYFEVDAIQGLWAVDYNDLEDSLFTGNDSFTPYSLYAETAEIIDSVSLIDKKTIFFTVDLDSEMKFQINQLQVTKTEIQKLHYAITTGEPLKSRFNDASLAMEIHKKESHRQRPMENNSPKKAMALMSLSEYVLKKAELAPELMNRPDALQTAINKELLKNSIPEIEGKTLYGAFQVAITHRKKL